MVILCKNSHQHTTDGIKPIFLLQDLQWGPVAQSLMRTRMVIHHFPEAVLISALFRTREAEDMKTFVIIGSMASLDKPVLPRGAGLNRSMLNPQDIRHLLKRCPAFRMRRIPHRKRPRIVGHDEKKGGNRSQAR